MNNRGIHKAGHTCPAPSRMIHHSFQKRDDIDGSGTVGIPEFKHVFFPIDFDQAYHAVFSVPVKGDIGCKNAGIIFKFNDLLFFIRADDLIYDRDGKVAYHSLPSMVDVNTAWTPRLSGIGAIESRLRVLPDGSQVYDLAKPFRPIDFSFPAGDTVETFPGLKRYTLDDSVLVLGMNLKAFDEARQADLHHAVIMAAIVIALGAGAFFFIFVIQNYYLVDRTLEETRDYTKQVEEMARQSEKLAAVGKLASGVAHEIRNPLSSIRGFAQFLSRSLSDRPREKEYADIMVKEVDRINGVVSDLLTLSRSAAPELDLVDMEKLVNHAVRLVEDDAESRNIQIHKNMPVPMEKVLLDANQITQALLNLLLNAIQGVESDGNITIGIHPDRALKRIILWVEDDGPGIPVEMREKIFDPFVTTREEGNGLGLAIVRTIVGNHMGDIRLESPPPGKSKGSRFTIYFPVYWEFKSESAGEK